MKYKNSLRIWHSEHKVQAKAHFKRFDCQAKSDSLHHSSPSTSLIQENEELFLAI